MSKFSNLVQQVSLLATVGPTRTGVQSRAQRQGVPLTTTPLSAADVLYALQGNLTTAGDELELDLADGTASGTAEVTATAEITLAGSDNNMDATSALSGAEGNGVEIEAVEDAVTFLDVAVAVNEKKVVATYSAAARIEITGTGSVAGGAPLAGGVYELAGVYAGRSYWYGNPPGSPSIDVFIFWDPANTRWAMGSALGTVDYFFEAVLGDIPLPESGDWNAADGGSGDPETAAAPHTANDLIAAVNGNPSASALLTLANAAGNDGTGSLEEFAETLAGGEGTRIVDGGVDFEGDDLPAMSAVRAIMIEVLSGTVDVSDGSDTDDLGTLEPGLMLLSAPAGDVTEKFDDGTLKLVAGAEGAVVRITVAAKRAI